MPSTLAPNPAPPDTGSAEVSHDELDESVAAESDEAQADQTAKDIFGSEDNARRTAGLITSFVESWEQHKHDKSPAVWLADEFRRHPDIWADEEEIVSTAKEVVANVEQANADKASLHDHLDAGKSKASWLAKKIEQGAAAAGVSSVGEYAATIHQAIGTANEQMQRAVKTQSDAFNQGPNLDGFIAEQHHVDTFNIDAAAKGSSLRAEAPGGQGKNSVDIVIRDAHGKGNIVGRYQSKYGQDAEATQHQFEKGDYRGQRKLGPADQEGPWTDVIEADGVRSKPLTKGEAKALQEDVQQKGEIRRHDWNDATRIEIAKQVGKAAVVNAALACGFQGARILGRRVWNFVRGKQNPPASEDLREFFESSIKSAVHVGAQTAVSGAVVVAAKSGWINALKHTPVGKIVGIVHVGIENAKVLYKFAKGELSGEQAIDAMGNCTASAVGGIVGAAKGAAIGTAVGGPIGTVVGGVVGGIAGSKIGEAVYEGGKTIVKTAAKVVKNVAAETIKAVGRVLNPLNWVS